VLFGIRNISAHADFAWQVEAEELASSLLAQRIHLTDLMCGENGSPAHGHDHVRAAHHAAATDLPTACGWYSPVD